MHDNQMETLFRPLAVKNITLRNRFVMPAMQRGLVKSCEPTEAMTEYLRLRGEGGVGLIISEGVSPDHPSAYWQDIFCHLSPHQTDTWRTLVGTVKQTGASFLLQLWHSGALREVVTESPYSSYPSLSPSGLIQGNRPNGRAASVEELAEIKDSYVRAALFAKDVGADGVEVHSCHGYLLDQFLWAETNRRTDEFGGRHIEDRARFPADVVAAIRSAVGEDFIISFRFSQSKEVDYAARIVETPEELSSLLNIIRTAGADCFNVSSRRFYKPEWPDRDASLGIAGWAKRMTDALVISVGSVGLDTDVFEDMFDHRDPKSRLEGDLVEVARRMQAGEFDLIGVGRAQIANSDFVRKVRDGRYAEISAFNKALHLKEFMADWEVGAVEDSRKVSNDM